MIRQTKRIRRFQDKEYRETYVEAFLNSYVAAQIRALRESRKLSQSKLAELIGTKQSGVSKLEDVNYSRWSIRTLKRLAKAFDVVLVVKFVAFGEALSEIANFSASTLVKPRFAEDPVFRSAESPLTSVSTGTVAEARDISQYQGRPITSRAEIPRYYEQETSPGGIYSATA